MAEIRLRSQKDTLLPQKLALYLLNRDLDRAKKAVIIRLLMVDGIIIVTSGVAAYVLAGKTLEPLEESLEEQRRFIADASHELKTPITSLRTELEVALREGTLRDKTITTKEARQLFISNLEDVMNLQKLSENLIKLNKYSQNGNAMHIEEVQIKEVLDEAIKKIAPMAKMKNIKLVKEITNFNLRVDKQSIVELFTILLDNAVKYSLKKSSIFITSSLINKTAKINIRDEGSGISSEDIPHLFDRFYRSDSSRNKQKADGYGLGLAIAKEIVERHKGNIRVRSKAGKGTTFTVTLHV